MLTSQPEQTWRFRTFLRVLMILVLVLPGLLMAVLGLPDRNTVLVAIGLACFGGGAWLFIAMGRMEITLHADGVRRRGLTGEVGLRWEEIVDYRWRSFAMNTGAAHFGLVGALVGALANRSSTAPEQVVLKLNARDGRRVTLTSNWADAVAASQLLVDRVQQRSLALLAAEVGKGGDVAFGPVTLGRDFIRYNAKQAPFSTIESIRVAQGVLRVKATGKFLALFSVGTMKIPNLFILLDGLKARGVTVADPRDGSLLTSGYRVVK